MKIVFFEDAHFASLYPLVYLRPVFELRCGAFSVRERIGRMFAGAAQYFETRDLLEAVSVESYGRKFVNSPDALRADDDVLLVNGGAILTGTPQSYVSEEGAALSEDGELIWAFLRAETIGKAEANSVAELALKAAELVPTRRVEEDFLVRYPWDLISRNAEQIERDFRQFFQPAMNSQPMNGAEIAGERENLFIGEGTEIQPHTFIDCRQGPVIISGGVTVHAHTSIQGPTFIGEDTRLFEAKIREGCSIGHVCRVGGEVEETIIHGHANKYHTGFLGHSYVCEWVNLGALTVNSDLKNDYSTVQVYCNGRLMDTGSIKVGSFIGDHTKTGIGTALNTGSVIGIMCILTPGSGLLPKHIPSFSWYVRDRISKGLGLKAALQTARTAMGRRGVELTEAMTELIRRTEEITREEKMEKVRKDRKKAH